MSSEPKGLLAPSLLVLLALALWTFAFAVPWGNFWVKISISAAILAVSSLIIRPQTLKEIRFDGRAVLLGLISATALYLLFMAGKFVSEHFFSFAGHQIGGIYGVGFGTRHWAIALILFFVTGPAEELFWRAFLQRRLQARWGGAVGYIVAACAYAGVHVPAWNFMLFGAAGIAGLFWGAFYWRFKHLGAVIISHSVWSSVIFAVLPLQ